MSGEKETVLLTGVTGYLAQFIAKQLLETGKFKVLGTYRNKEKVIDLINNFEHNEDLSTVFVEDMGKTGAFDETFKEYGPKINYVIHAAAPYNWDITDCEDGFISPGINGIKSLFTAALKYAPNLKHFTITSSFAAMLDTRFLNDPTHVFDEKSWNPITLEEALTSNRLAYRYSKTMAERTMWELAKELKPHFGVSSVIPNLILGPQCFDSTVSTRLNTSCEYVNKYIKSKPGDEVAPNPSGGVIDVRDLARAHIETLLDSKKFDGERLFLTNESYGNQTFVDILNQIPQLQGNIAKGTPHRDDGIAERKAQLGDAKTRELLGFSYIPLEKTVKDLALQVLKVQGKV